MFDEKYGKFLANITNWQDAESGRERARQSRAFKREFAEWHFNSGHFVGGDLLQANLQTVWRLASGRKQCEAELRIDEIKARYSRLLRTLRQHPSGYDNERMERAFLHMLDTLAWLRGKVGSLRVCENPDCQTTRTYFFRVYTNDKYCSARCLQVAKAVRQSQRDLQVQKPPKQHKRSPEARRNMSVSATRRWARERAKKGRPK